MWVPYLSSRRSEGLNMNRTGIVPGGLQAGLHAGDRTVEPLA